MTINAYIHNYRISLLDSLNYRINFFISLFTGFFTSYATVAIWYVITDANRDMLSLEMVNRTMQYMILASIINTVYYSISESEITQRVSSGEIARDLVYPISLPVSLFFKALGSSTVCLLTRALPTLVVLSAIYHIGWGTNYINIINLILFGLMGYYMIFLIIVQVDMLSFWVYETQALQYIRSAVVSFLSGSIVPLWFYPEWLLKVLDLLPFKNIVYIPIAFYLGEISTDRFFTQLIIALFWCFVLTMTTCIIWKQGARKIVVHGG